MEMKEILLEKLKDAELVLVGIGEEFDNCLEVEADSELVRYRERMMEKEDTRWILSHIEADFVKRCRDERKAAAYRILEQLLEDKNYFIVSTNMDDYIYDTQLKKERIVTPCGGYRLLQCQDGCKEILSELPEAAFEAVCEKIEEMAEPESIEVPTCPVCGKPMIYNNKLAKKYVEAAYLPDWQNYTRWLQGTVNKRLCVLELGVGMKYPNVIRWPFEKIVYFNQKASIFRIHSKLYQLTEEIKDKGYKIQEKPIDFLINWFV